VDQLTRIAAAEVKQHRWATQNRDTLALQLKLDELIVATRNARNELAGIEEAPDVQIEKARDEVLKRAV
jgi:low affinity Fe/Cu permease